MEAGARGKARTLRKLSRQSIWACALAAKVEVGQQT